MEREILKGQKKKCASRQLDNFSSFFFQSSLHFTFTPLRYIELDNGLQALLISDYSGPAASEDEDEDGEEEEQDDESGDEMEEESEEEDDDDDNDEKGSDYDDDDEGKKKKGNAEKQVLIFKEACQKCLGGGKNSWVTLKHKLETIYMTVINT